MALLAPSPRAAVLREAGGLVQVRAPGAERWTPAGALPRPLAAGSSVRTGFGARAVIALEGDASIEAGGSAQLVVDETAGGGAAIDLVRGAARARASSDAGRALEIRTAVGSARARSSAAVWRTTVGESGAVFEAEDGVVGVEGVRGSALRLRGGERVEADLAGLHEPTLIATPARVRRESFAERMRRELAFEEGLDAVQNLVSGEIRREEHELGRVLVGSDGSRVRAEEFVLRESPSSFAFVALNERRGAGLSWFAWTGVFDAALPRDLSAVFAALPGSVGAAAPWTLTDFTTVRSNGVDSLVFRASGGHQVDVNHNADPSDDVSWLYRPGDDSQASVAGRPVFKVIFDRAGLYSDGVLKRGWTGSNLQSQADQVPASANDPLTGAALAAPLPVFTSNATFPDAGAARQVVLESYSDGTAIATDSRSLSPGAGWGTGTLLRSPFEQTTTAGEFGGRSIRLTLSPRVLFETGGLP